MTLDAAVKFAERVGESGPNGDVRDLIRELNKASVEEPKPREEGALSKRAEKRVRLFCEDLWTRVE